MQGLQGSTPSAATPASDATTAGPVGKRIKTWSVPQPNEDGKFKKDVLFVEFGYTRGNNNHWLCPVAQCGAKGQGTTRLREHSEKHIKLVNYKAFHESQFNKSGGQTMESNVAKSGASSLPPGQSTVAHHFDLQRQVTSTINLAVSKMIIARGEPTAIVEDPTFIGVMQACIEAGRASANVSADNVFGRTAMTDVVDKMAKDVYANLRERLMPLKALESRRISITLSCDGRMSIKKQPLLVFNAEVPGGFLPLGALDPGAQSKDAKYLADLVTRFLHEEDLSDGLGAYIIAVVMDGAPVNIAAMRRLCSEGLIPVRCQSHAVSLFATHLMNGPFSATRKYIDQIFGLLCDNNRAFKLFEEATDGGTLTRPCPTRFATYFYAAHSLLKHANEIKGLFVSNKFSAWIDDDATSSAKTTWIELEGVVLKGKFWKELEDVRNVLAVVVQVLRFFDQTGITPSAVYTLWRSMGDMIIDRLKASSIEKHVQETIYKLYIQDLEKAECDVLVAAHVLDPGNRAEMQELASSRVSMYRAKRAATMRVLELLLQRRPLVLEDRPVTADDLSRELDEYFTKENGVLNFNPQSDSPRAWYLQFGALGILASQILEIKVTISDVERVNKVYAYTQTPERNRLLLSRVNGLVKGRLAIKAEQRGAIARNVGVPKFIEEVDQLAVDAQDFLQSLKSADQSLQAIDQAELHVDELDTQPDERGALTIGPTVTDLVAENAEKKEEEQAAEASSIDDQRPFVPAPQLEIKATRRSTRMVSLTPKFKAALNELGLTNFDTVGKAAKQGDAEEEDEEEEEVEVGDNEALSL